MEDNAEVTLAAVSTGALNSTLVLRGAIAAVRDNYTHDGRLAAYLGSVFDIEEAGKSAACDKLLYATDRALHALIDIAGNLNCTGDNTIPGAIELAMEPCKISEPLASDRDDLLRLARAIEDADTLSSGIDLFTRGGDSIDD